MGGVLEDAEVVQPVVLSLGEWLAETLNLFSDTLSAVMDVGVLRFFAVFGVFLVAVSLARVLLREGQR